MYSSLTDFKFSNLINKVYFTGKSKMGIEKILREPNMKGNLDIGDRNLPINIPISRMHFTIIVELSVKTDLSINEILSILCAHGLIQN